MRKMNTDKTLCRELNQSLRKMDVPRDKIGDYKWLIVNLGKKNSNHPEYHRAMSVLREIILG